MQALTKSNASAVKMARLHLRFGNPHSYALGMSAAIRAAATQGQVRLLWLAIDADDMGRWFDDSNVLCPVAREVEAA